MRYRLNEAHFPRLGLIVSKKTAKLAVQRNYMRRVLRELFRLNQHNCPIIDLIIQVQKPFKNTEFTLIKQEFEILLAKLSVKLAPTELS